MYEYEINKFEDSQAQIGVVQKYIVFYLELNK